LALTFAAPVTRRRIEDDRLRRHGDRVGERQQQIGEYNPIADF
jgi:hypothetical protein